MTPLRITVDANCIINLFDTNSETATSVEPLSELVRFAMSGRLQIAATTRVESDINKDKDDKRRKDILRALSLFPIIPSIGRWDTSKWDSDEWSDQTSEHLAEEIKQIIFPGLQTDDRRYGNKINDVDHLVGHALDRRDIFVTDDRTILKNREPLRRGLGIVVMNPTDCLAHVASRIAG